MFHKTKNVLFLSLALPSLIAGESGLAGNVDHYSTNTLSPNDYLFGANGALGDPVFDKYRTISLDVDIGIGSDCGRINITNTLRAALKNILDSKYLESMGRDGTHGGVWQDLGWHFPLLFELHHD